MNDPSHRGGSELGAYDPPRAAASMDFSDEQRQLIRDTFANGCSDAEFAVLMEVARARRLNPLFRQIHFVQRWDSEKHRMVWATQVSIDGLRAIAQRTGLYQGQDEPEFVENADGTLKLCKVRAWRRDWPRPAVGVAYWAEYVQTTRDKQTGKTRPTAMWSRMPHVMLAKVAEAIALRKAFPEDMAGLYTNDEMAQATPAPTPPPKPVAQRTELHIHASLPAVASAPEAPPPPPPPAQVIVAEPVAPTEVKRTGDPWLDYYG
jgi:phage recombination protein Bet